MACQDGGRGNLQGIAKLLVSSRHPQTIEEDMCNYSYLLIVVASG